jgi:thioredoxin reductase (NADPH)
MNFAKYAERVVILVRGSSLASTMSQYLIDQIKETPNIQVWAHASVTRRTATPISKRFRPLFGHNKVNACRRAPCSFSSARCREPTGWRIVERDERGFILTGPDLMP